MSRFFTTFGKNTEPRFYLCATISALLCALPFTFPDLFVVSWFSLIPFFSALLSDRFFALKKKESFLLGFFWGFIYCSSIYYWFLELYPFEFIGFSKPVAVFVVILAWFGISAFQAITFGFGTMLFKILKSKNPLIIATIFMLCEFFWQIGPLAMPWCKISISQYKFLPSIQSSAMFGSLFVSFIIYAFNAYMAKGFQKKSSFGIAAILFFSNLLYGTIILNIPTSYTTTANFALIQGNISSSQKWHEGTTDKSFDMFSALSREAAEKYSPDFIVWPETAVPVHINTDYNSKKFTKVACDTKSIFLCGGFSTSDNGISNSLFMIDKNGVNDIYYNKRHLVPFGEYLPARRFFETFMPFIANINMLSDDLVRGSSPQTITSPYGKLGSLICFDSIFPSLARESVLDGAEIIILVTNDSWYLDSPATTQHNAQAVFRAIENRRCVVRCANTGISSIINENGKITASLSAMKKGVLYGSANFTNTHTLYTYVGDIIVYIAALYILILIFRRCKAHGLRKNISL